MMISPWAPPNDIVWMYAICQMQMTRMARLLSNSLNYYDSGEDCPSIAFRPSPEQVHIVAIRLNIVYGIQ